MKMLICAVHDGALGAYMQPFFSRSEGESIRGFSDACRDDKMPFKGHLADYTLFLLGSFDDTTGTVECEPAPRKLVTGIQFKDA